MAPRWHYFAMRAELFTVRSSVPGTLSTMARPRGADWLADEMGALRDARTDILVSLLSPIEAHELGLAEEAEAAKAAGLRFFALPVPDGGTPESATFGALVRLLTEEFDKGRHIVVHCRMGIGRSSMVAAAVLMAKGFGKDEAWAAVSKARGLGVPDRPQQRQWVKVANAGGTV